jgi:hypothetical protein
MRAGDPALSPDVFVEKESVLRLQEGGDPVEGALAAARAAGWKDALDRKLSNALGAAGLLAAPQGPKLGAPREVVL